MLRSLRMRLTLILILLMVSVMTIVGVFLLNNISNYYHDDFRRQMEQVFTDSFISSLENVSEPGQFPSQAKRMLETYRGQLGLDSYRDFYILDGTAGVYLEGSNSALGANLDKTPNLLSALSGKTGAAVSTSFNYIDFALSVTASDGARYVIYIKDSKEEISGMIWMFFAIIIQAIFFGLILAVALSFFLSRTITIPIEDLTKGVEKVAGGDYSGRLEVTSKDEIGRLTQTFNFMADMLKTTIDEVNSERQKLETIFKYLEDGVAAFTKEKEILHINLAARRMLGLEGDQFPSSFEEVFPEAHSGIQFEEILSPGENENLIRDIEQKDRILRAYFASFEPDSDSKSGLAGGVIAVVHDITEQQRLEDARKEFIANVSHELRTPLTSIKSYAETVAQYGDLPPEQLSKFMRVITNEADRMTRIVKDLLLLSRLDNKKMDWKFDWMNIEQTVERVCDTMLPQAIEHYHTLKCAIENPLPEMYGDKERLEQVLVNIISNAIKYTPDGGSIRVRAKSEDGCVKIAVQDNGIGIPQEEQKRLFERFYRVDKARSRERGGTGLGLAIAKEIVESHRGKISVKSEFERGTEITIELPCHPPEGKDSGGEEI